MTNAAELHRLAVELGKRIVRMTTAAGSGHPSSALSLAHITSYLMFHKMRHDPADPWNPASDRLILSEGHAVPVVYAAWALLGGVVGRSRSDARRLTDEDLLTLRARESVLDGHPNPAEGFPFFDAATGSLGQGLSVAAGLALAAREDGLDRRFYVLIGDGESREGQVWEAADFVVDHQLTSVCAIFNCNGQGQADFVSPQQSADRLTAKLEAFGWQVVSIDGHDPEQIEQALAGFGENERPLAVVARTIKGWGVEMLQQGNWHGKPLPADKLDEALASLDRTLSQLAPDASGSTPAPPKPAAATPKSHPEPGEVEWPSFREAVEAAGLASALEKGKLATRRGYGVALRTAGDLLPQVVALDGDVSNSTMAGMFAQAHPDRFYECKIAEQNMISAAAGLSAAGRIAFANSFAKFLARGYDQLEMAVISRANIKLVGSHAGVSLAADGPSQMGLPDVAYFRSYTTVRADDRTSPLCWLFQPADAVAAYRLTRLMTCLPGLCYMRTHRPDVPLLYDDDAEFRPGGLNVLRSGEDAALIASGYMVHVALRAAELLAQQNLRVAVIDAYSLPLDADRLLELLARSGRVALAVEDNFGGGFGSAVAEVAAAGGGLRVRTLNIQRLPKSTRTPDEAVEYAGVSAEQIADHLLAHINEE